MTRTINKATKNISSLPIMLLYVFSLIWIANERFQKKEYNSCGVKVLRID